MSSVKQEEVEEETTKQECIEIEIIPYNLLKYISSDEFNKQDLCRICFGDNNPEMYSLVHTKESGLLPDIFSTFTGIQVLPDETMPTNICNTCKCQLVNSYEFKLKCTKSDCILKSLLKAEFVTKDEDCHLSVENIEENPKNNNSEDKMKEEDEDLVEDVQYLEDLSDDETLCIVQNKEKETIKKSQTSVADTKLNVEQKNEINPKKHKSNVCSLCSKRYSNGRALSNHMKRSHSNIKHPHACTQCKDIFNSDHDLKLHLSLHNKGPVWTCVECQKEFKGRSMFRRHIERHMELKKWSCDACGKPFAELYALRRHARVHSGQRVEKRHVCALCDKRFSEAKLLAAHLARHSGSRPYVCTVCGKTFPSTRLLSSHHLVHSDHKPYACRYCDKRFRHESTRNTHHRTHTGEKPYVCATCGKTFIQNSNLTLHMRTHTGERPYTCETCGCSFSSGSSLKTHIRTHTGEKPYSCNVCGKKFARLDMSAHMRQHTGERPFECGVCHRKFITAARLREHCRIHTGEKPFECAMCTLKFTTKSHLVKHVKTHQSKKSENHDKVIVRRNSGEIFTNSEQAVSKLEVKEQSPLMADDEEESSRKDVGVDTCEDMPLEVSEEFVMHDDDYKSELLVVDDTPSANYQNGALCLGTSGVNYVNNDINYANNVNLVAVNEGEVRMLEGSTVKLYQLDQSLVQIHSSGGQVTISKITSKMTANF